MNYFYSYFSDQNISQPENCDNEKENKVCEEEEFIIVADSKMLNPSIGEDPKIKAVVDGILSGNFESLIHAITNNDEQLLFHLFLENETKRRKKMAKIFKNMKTGSSQSVLQLVVAFSSYNWVKLVISVLKEFNFLEEEINYKDEFGFAPIHYMAKNKDDTQILMKLLKNDANINLRDNEGKTAFHYIIENNFSQSFDHLISIYRDNQAKNNDNDGKKDIINIADSENRGIAKKSPLICLFDDNDDDQISFRSDKLSNPKTKHVNIYKKDKYGDCAIHYAALYSNPQFLLSLLRIFTSNDELNLQRKSKSLYRQNLSDMKNKLGQIPLHYSFRSLSISCTDLLLRHHSDFHITSEDDHQPANETANTNDGDGDDIDNKVANEITESTNEYSDQSNATTELNRAFHDDQQICKYDTHLSTNQLTDDELQLNFTDLNNPHSSIAAPLLLSTIGELHDNDYANDANDNNDDDEDENKDAEIAIIDDDDDDEESNQMINNNNNNNNNDNNNNNNGDNNDDDESNRSSSPPIFDSNELIIDVDDIDQEIENEIIFTSNDGNISSNPQPNSIIVNNNIINSNFHPISFHHHQNEEVNDTHQPSSMTSSSSSSSTSQIIESKLIYQTTIQSNDNTIINDYLSPLHPSSPDHQNAPDLHIHRHHHHPQLQIISDYLNSSVHHRNVDNEDSNEGTEYVNNTKSGDSSSHQNTLNKQSSNRRHHQFNSSQVFYSRDERGFFPLHYSLFNYSENSTDFLNAMIDLEKLKSFIHYLMDDLCLDLLSFFDSKHRNIFHFSVLYQNAEFLSYLFQKCIELFNRIHDCGIKENYRKLFEFVNQDDDLHFNVLNYSLFRIGMEKKLLDRSTDHSTHRPVISTLSTNHYVIFSDYSPSSSPVIQLNTELPPLNRPSSSSNALSSSIHSMSSFMPSLSFTSSLTSSLTTSLSSITSSLTSSFSYSTLHSFNSNDETANKDINDENNNNDDDNNHNSLPNNHHLVNQQNKPFNEGPISDEKCSLDTSVEALQHNLQLENSLKSFRIIFQFYLSHSTNIETDLSHHFPLERNYLQYAVQLNSAYCCKKFLHLYLTFPDHSVYLRNIYLVLGNTGSLEIYHLFRELLSDAVNYQLIRERNSRGRTVFQILASKGFYLLLDRLLSDYPVFFDQLRADHHRHHHHDNNDNVDNNDGGVDNDEGRNMDFGNEDGENGGTELSALVDMDGNNILFYAIYHRKIECVNMIINKYAELMAGINYQNRSIFHAAAKSGDANLLRLILSTNRKISHLIDKKDNEKVSAMMIACRCGHSDVVHVLLKSDLVDMFQVNEMNNCNLIHYSCLSGNIQLVQYVVYSMIDKPNGFEFLHRPSIYGTPLQIAKRLHFHDIALFLTSVNNLSTK